MIGQLIFHSIVVRRKVDLFVYEWERQARILLCPHFEQLAKKSMVTKQFHLYGGAMCSFLGRAKLSYCLEWILVYQMMCDYLDQLCDEAPTFQWDDHVALHDALVEAIDLERKPTNRYYRYRQQGEDRGFLLSAVLRCRTLLRFIEPTLYADIRPQLLALCRAYCDLQCAKHLAVAERDACLQRHLAFREAMLSDDERAAAMGSTLGIFAIVAHSFSRRATKLSVGALSELYAPYIQSFHILLDYWIDAEEDERTGQLNFCRHYQNEAEFVRRMLYLRNEIMRRIGSAGAFHRLLVEGLIAIYAVRSSRLRALVAQSAWRTKLCFTLYPFIIGK